MGKLKRVTHVLSGILMILGSILLVRFPDIGCQIVIAFLALSLLASGVSRMIYFFTYTRYMVGGIRIFYKAVLLLDFGLFVFNLDDLPMEFAMLYLAGGMLFSGAMGILHAKDARDLESRAWKLDLLYGFSQIVLAVIGLFFLHSVRTMTILFSISLLQSAVSRIMTAFRRTAIVYIEYDYPI